MRILIRSTQGTGWKAVESVAYSAETELQQLLAESPSLVPIQDIQGIDSQLVAAVTEFGLPGPGATDVVLF